MSENSQIVRALHEDHMAVLGLLSRLETACQVTAAPRGDDGSFRSLAARFSAAVETEVRGHFDFEERDLFPPLRAAGFDDLADLLTEEHGVIWPLATQVAAQVRHGCDDGWSAERWVAFRPLALELVERLRSHIEKEERALAQAVADTFEADADMEIAMAYAS